MKAAYWTVGQYRKGVTFVSVTGGFGLIRPVRLLLMVTAALTLALSIALPSDSYAAQPEPQTPGAGRWEEFGGLVVPLVAAEGITLRIITDVGVIAPTYQSFPRDNDRWIEHFASKLPAANRSFRSLLQASGWGHIAPYVYAAAYHSLGRIFIGFSSNSALADGRSLIPKVALAARGDPDQAIRAALSTRRQPPLPGWSRPLRPSTTPARGRLISACPDAADALRSQQRLDQGHPETAVAHMEEFVNWLVLRLSAHELTHAIQQGTGVEQVPDSPSFGKARPCSWRRTCSPVRTQNASRIQACLAPGPGKERRLRPGFRFTRTARCTVCHGGRSVSGGGRTCAIPTRLLDHETARRRGVLCGRSRCALRDRVRLPVVSP